MSEQATASNSRKNWLILVAIGAFTFMSTLDSSIVNIALPTISKELHVPMNQATWTVSIYLIAVSGLLIFFGRLGDLIGKIKIFKIGTIIFTFGSLIAGFNLGIWFLLFARFIQAFGAAMTMSNSFGITTSTFPPHQRSRAMATIGVFVSLGAVAGPGLGGLILQFLPWSYIFWVNVPIGILAIIMGEKLFPKVTGNDNVPKLDWVGTILFFLMISSLFLSIEVGQNKGFIHAFVLILFALSILLFIAFVYYELHHPDPMIDLTIFKNQLFTISLIAAMLIFVTNFFSSIILPFYLQDLLKMSPGQSGIIMMVFPIVMMITSPIGGYLGDKHDKEKVTAFGIAIVVISQLGYITFNQHTSIAILVLFTGLNAAGASLFQSPNNALVMSSVPKNQLGVAGSVNALARNLGMITGISIATTTLFTSMSLQVGHRVTSYVPGRPDVFLTGMHIAFAISFVIALITLLIVCYRLFSRKKAA
ncbi:MAG: MFS transporter [Lactobacillales bacterium]|jgi:EmrB/QacA subfamily drug resistance transporter|nr:MFS transporter [Lactobacillales bacterium]